jgi:hypothetical protein
MTEPAKPAAPAHAPAAHPAPDALKDAKDAKEEAPPEPRAMLSGEPEFELTPDIGTGWYAYRCDAPAVLPQPEHPEGVKAKAPEEEKPAQPIKSETGKIEGTVEANSPDEAKLKILKAYPGARFKNPAAAPVHTPKP